MAIFNSKEYAWQDLKVVMLGRQVTGIRGIRYKVSQEKEEVYAAGNEPRAIQLGNKKYEGELTLLQSELEALTRAAGAGKDVTDLEFDVVISYVPSEGSPIVTDVVKYAQFTDCEKQLKQNDKFMEVSLPFIALGIEKNI